MTFLKTDALGPSAEKLKRDLNEGLVGQPKAIEGILNVYQLYLAGLSDPRTPVGSFLLMGPTGCGKTHTVESLARSLHGKERAYTKIDCAEFQHSHEIAKLIGSPPGYLGHRETHPMLSQKLIDTHNTAEADLSIILFDEVEKASDALWTLLLGVLDKASLTLGDNSRVDFSKSIIFLTSNLGTEAMGKAAKGYAFSSFVQETAEAKDKRIESAAKDALKRKFTPEFINRLDTVITYQQLTEDDISEILNLELDKVQAHIADTLTPFKLKVTTRAKAKLLSDGYSAQYGARNLKRAIRRSVLMPIANLITSGQITPGCEIDVTVANGKYMFLKDKSKISNEKAA